MLLASIDALTKKDYLYRFKQGFKELTMFFVSANSDKDYNYEVDQILNKTFIYKYRSLKTIFQWQKMKKLSDNISYLESSDNPLSAEVVMIKRKK